MKTQRLFPLLAVLALIVAAWWFLPRDPGRPSAAPPESRRQSDITQSKQGVAKTPGKPAADEASEGATAPDVAVTRLIESAMARFSASPGATESAAILEQLRNDIRNADHRGAALAVVDFLKTGMDVPTKLPFVVGPEGVMETVPTLRTALLDLLVGLDPVAALDNARLVMDAKNSPDEYALALRNLAWNDLDGDLKNELSSRFHGMLVVKDWIADPSAGFLEAFDAAVKLDDTPSFDALARINKDASPDNPLARASFIALDRMVLGSPSLLVHAYAADPGLTDLTPDLRASLLSRLDLTDPDQRDIISRYLAAPDHGPKELDYFAAIFPNGSYLHGNWLITTGEPSQSIESRLAADRAVLAEIERMQASAQGDATAALARIHEKLLRVTKPDPESGK